MDVVILGPAGSGKGLLTASFGKYLQREGYTVKFMNLDPGCAVLPYKGDFDMRSVFTIKEIMRSEELGPNGAMLRAVEKICDIEIPRLERLHFNRHPRTVGDIRFPQVRTKNRQQAPKPNRSIHNGWNNRRRGPTSNLAIRSGS